MEASTLFKFRIWITWTCCFWGMYFIGKSLANLWEYGTVNPVQIACNK